MKKFFTNLRNISKKSSFFIYHKYIFSLLVFLLLSFHSLLALNEITTKNLLTANLCNIGAGDLSIQGSTINS